MQPGKIPASSLCVAWLARHWYAQHGWLAGDKHICFFRWIDVELKTRRAELGRDKILFQPDSLSLFLCTVLEAVVQCRISFQFK